MSGQNGPDEAARLEAALARIARAAGRPRRSGAADAATPILQPPQAAGTTHAYEADIAARLDSLIAELRDVLGTPPL